MTIASPCRSKAVPHADTTGSGNAKTLGWADHIGYNRYWDGGGGDEMTATGQREQHPTGGAAPRVVMVGADFGGLAAVRRLARAGMQITLIDRNIYATFQPLLYEVASAGLSSSDVAYPARSVSRRYHAAFRHGELAGIDTVVRRITLVDGATLGYDYLILATGVPRPTTASPGQPNTAWACTPATTPSFCATGS